MAWKKPLIPIKTLEIGNPLWLARIFQAFVPRNEEERMLLFPKNKKSQTKLKKLNGIKSLLRTFVLESIKFGQLFYGL